jgi:iron complex outermembrane receptor protein
MDFCRYLGFGAIAMAMSFGLAAQAKQFDIPAGALSAALDSYAAQTGVHVFYAAHDLRGAQTMGVKGDMPANAALLQLLSGTGFGTHIDSGVVEIVHKSVSSSEMPQDITSMNIAASAAPTVSGGSLETVTVTSSKIGSDIQNIPIAITALSQEQLTATQTAGGPDLVKQVPNLTFTKTNFSGYSIEIRGIGTQAISVTTDPAVAVAFNDIPFIRNHFFEQEFYDVAQVEVLRGPQGTLYGRNATAGVVNLVSAKPTDQFEAMASIEIGNYGERRPEGMINIPVVDDQLDVRVAGEWTKRQGYSFNGLTDQRIDGRDLWSGRVSIGWKPMDDLQTYLVWEHFSEDDDRLRSSKQLCEKDPGPASVDGQDATQQLNGAVAYEDFLSQGCLPTSLYAPTAFETPNGRSIPFILAGAAQFGAPCVGGGFCGDLIEPNVDPYASVTQSRNLRVIQSALNPTYKAKNDTVELNTDYVILPTLTLTSQTGYNSDFLYSTEDYNRFNTSPGIFGTSDALAPGGVFCDPQLGCSNRIVGEDLSTEHAWQLSQEFRLASNFSGPLNFSAGGNYLHYETEESYYVFVNALSLIALDQSYNVYSTAPYVPGTFSTPCQHVYPDPNVPQPAFGCVYIDPNPLNSLNNRGHNYFLNQNPYTLNSYAGFGEVYYQMLPSLKLTGGLRWTEDEKRFVEVPSWLAVPGWGYPTNGTLNQQWDELTGRFVANWSPKIDFTDQTLIYASYSRGYKAGGANPPPPALGFSPLLTHPLTFAPEFINAYEVGTKNTALDGTLTLNVDAFYYDYTGYQISEIVDRTAVNLNFNATVKGAEVETTWEPIPGLKFNFAGGWEDTALAAGSQAIDLIDRTAGNSDWVVVKPFITQTSNCVLPAYVEAALIEKGSGLNVFFACWNAYTLHIDPVTAFSGTGPAGYTGFDPSTAPNDGAGFVKNLSGNQLPNAPPFTVSFGTQYTMPLTSDWAGTLHGDFYWQDNSWARIFNDNPYDRLHGYDNLNLTLIFTNQNGWQVMLYDKNVFNTTAITGDFLNSDDSGLTTNVFLTDPKLIGIRVTKNW